MKPEFYFLMFFKIAGLITIITILASCNTSLYKPTLIESADTAEFEALQKGRQLYIDNCASCHTLYYPHQFNASVWKEELSKMKSKTKLSDSETELIYKYVTGGKRQK